MQPIPTHYIGLSYFLYSTGECRFYNEKTGEYLIHIYPSRKELFADLDHVGHGLGMTKVETYKRRSAVIEPTSKYEYRLILRNSKRLYFVADAGAGVLVSEGDYATDLTSERPAKGDYRPLEDFPLWVRKAVEMHRIGCT